MLESGRRELLMMCRSNFVLTRRLGDHKFELARRAPKLIRSVGCHIFCLPPSQTRSLPPDDTTPKNITHSSLAISPTPLHSRPHDFCLHVERTESGDLEKLQTKVKPLQPANFHSSIYNNQTAKVRGVIFSQLQYGNAANTEKTKNPSVTHCTVFNSL